MSGITNDEATFVVGVSRQTGIDPRVLIAWIQQEGAYADNGTGGHNYLNLRPYAPSDVGVESISGGNFDRFATVQDAIASTVARLKQPFAAPIIAAARARVTPAQEIAAIASTGWDAGHYGGAGGPNLQKTFAAIFSAAGLTAKYEGPDDAQGIVNTGVKGTSSGADPPGILGSGTLGGVPGAIGGAAKHIPGVQQGVDAVNATKDAVDSIPKLVRFITSWRFAEIVGGFLLLLVGVALLARQFGVTVPGLAAANPAADKASEAAGPISEAPRRTQRRAGFEPQSAERDRRDARRARRGEPGSSRLAKGDEIPF